MSEIAWWRLTESIIFPAWWGGRWGCPFIAESCSVKLIAKISGRSFEFQLEFRESLGQKSLFVSERQRKRHRYLPLWISGVESKTPSSSQHRCPCSLNSHWRAIVHLFCLLFVKNFHPHLSGEFQSLSEVMRAPGTYTPNFTLGNVGLSAGSVMWFSTVKKSLSQKAMLPLNFRENPQLATSCVVQLTHICLE